MELLGDKLMLWSSRTSEKLNEAIKQSSIGEAIKRCSNQGLIFDFINKDIDKNLFGVGETFSSTQSKTRRTKKGFNKMKREDFINGMNSNIYLTIDDRKHIIKESVSKDHWKKKCTIVMEELSELIKETSKYIRGYRNKDRLLEEMADVYIALDYLKSIFHIEESDIKKAIDVKLDRESQRIMRREEKNKK